MYAVSFTFRTKYVFFWFLQLGLNAKPKSIYEYVCVRINIAYM